MGTRFPIALVHSGGLILEVSSFGTKAKRDIIPTDAATYLNTPAPRGKVIYPDITRCQTRVMLCHAALMSCCAT